MTAMDTATGFPYPRWNWPITWPTCGKVIGA